LGCVLKPGVVVVVVVVVDICVVVVFVLVGVGVVFVVVVVGGALQCFWNTRLYLPEWSSVWSRGAMFVAC